MWYVPVPVLYFSASERIDTCIYNVGVLCNTEAG
jgi:hypothetical protein